MTPIATHECGNSAMAAAAPCLRHFVHGRLDLVFPDHALSALRIAEKLNTRPRKRYGYRTAEDLFNQHHSIALRF
jgi:IS30 family transposase